MAVAAMGDSNGGGTIAMGDGGGSAMGGGMAEQSQWQWAMAKRDLSYWALSLGTAVTPLHWSN
jgi:hypothetical protein